MDSKEKQEHNDTRINLFNLNRKTNKTYIWPSLSFSNVYDSSMLRRGFKVYMNSPFADPEILYKHDQLLLNKVLTLEEIKELRYKYKDKMQKYAEPENANVRKTWSDILQNTIDTNSPYWVHVIKTLFPTSKPVHWVLSKIRRVSAREYKNTLYNILTGYGYYTPPSELEVPKGCYFNPYVRGMVTPMPSFLKDNMLNYDDGVKASVPQMAYDLTEFMSFLKYGHLPDRKFNFLNWALYLAVISPFIWLHRRQIKVNALSYRLEAYGIRTGGYRRFRERFINRNKLDA